MIDGNEMRMVGSLKGNVHTLIGMYRSGTERDVVKDLEEIYKQLEAVTDYDYLEDVPF